MKNKRGMTLIELILFLLILAISVPLLCSVFINSLEAYNSTNTYALQQQKVNEIIQFIRRDVEEAQGVKVIGNNKLELAFNSGKKYWNYDNENSSLQFSTDDINYENVVNEINVSFSKINGRLKLSIVPTNQNSGRFINRNVSDQIITEFSVKYKD